MDVYNPLTNKLGFEVKHNEIYHENYNKKTLKGVSKVVVKRDIAHKDYNDVLETKTRDQVLEEHRAKIG